MSKFLDFLGDVLEAAAEVSTQARVDFVRDLKNCTFDSTRLEMAKNIINGKSYLTSEDVRFMAETFDFDSNKVELAKYAWHRVIDPMNFRTVTYAIHFPMEQQRVLNYINTHPQKR